MLKPLSKLDIVRAWKDAEYRHSLSAEALAMLPANPAGLIELPDSVLGSVVGGLNIGLTHDTELCNVSGPKISCGWVCTLTTECGCQGVSNPVALA